MKARFGDLRQSWRASRARETLRKADLRALVPRYVPILEWFPKYPRVWLSRDAVGGLTTWAVMIPAAMAYAAGRCTAAIWLVRRWWRWRSSLFATSRTFDHHEFSDGRHVSVDRCAVASGETCFR
jgi:hypothetical protein